MTQNTLVLNHLRSGKSITPLEALKSYGIFRLGARIWELKQSGYDIKSKIVKNKQGKHFSSYFIEK